MNRQSSALAGRVRFGGTQTARGYRFELTGGRLCLDLANTLDERATDHPRELLPRYEDLLSWGVQAGAIRPAEAAALRVHTVTHRSAAARAVRRAIRVREALFRIFSALADGREAPADALALLNRTLAEAFGKRRLGGHGRRFVWRWLQATRPEFDRVLWPVVLSAADLLTSSDLDRVRRCCGTGCAWLFVDATKNRARRWCDMSVCGNRAKAKRHYAKVKTRATAARRTSTSARSGRTDG
jgi:predicted RNA-binding Zn ribbon-like protein